MQALFAVILPVFLVLGAGYLAVWLRYLDDEAIDQLMRFAQGVAIPTLLFLGVTKLDLAQALKPGLFFSFYAGALAAFVIGGLAARFVFGRPGPDSVAIGFACLFSNTLLLGVPITERAYGPGALAPNYALIAIHSPVMYAFGITAMEWVKSHGHDLSPSDILRRILSGLVRNPLIIGITLGFVVNLSGLALPEPAAAALEMIARAGLPAALFGLGGVLVRYRPEGDLRLVAMVAGLSLVLHPALTYLLATRAYGLSVPDLRSATITAAMAPGINAYLFAHMYGVGKRVAATSVLICTAASILTVWFWLQLLP